MAEFPCITLKQAIEIVHSELDYVIDDVSDSVIGEEDAFIRIEGLTLGMKIPNAEEVQADYLQRVRAILSSDYYDPGELA